MVPGAGDRLFVNTLAGARQDALNAALPSLGLEPGQFKVDSVISVVDGVLVSYDKFKPEDDKDREAPKFKVTWSKKKGAKVKVGDKIKVTIKASERYEDGHKSWPTGVYNIQLTADDGLVKSENYGRVPDPCATPFFEATYTVPANPKQIVHLTAIVEDGVGNKDSEVGEFPTGNKWEGTMHSETTGTYGSAATCTGEAWDFELRLVAGGDGTVEGKATAHLVSMPQCSGPPSWVKSTYDNQAKNSAWDVSGKFDGKQFELQFNSTQTDGSTGGLINYSLKSWRKRGLVTTIIVPLTSATTAQGETKTNVTVPQSAGSVASGHDSVNLKCTTCN